jgi:hypothetical protein
LQEQNEDILSEKNLKFYLKKAPQMKKKHDDFW